MKLSKTQQKTPNFCSPKIFHVHIVSQYARGMIALVGVLGEKSVITIYL